MTSGVEISICLFVRSRFEQLEGICSELVTHYGKRKEPCEILVVAHCPQKSDEDFLSACQRKHDPRKSGVRIFRMGRDLQNAAALRTLQSNIQGNILLTIDLSGQFVLEDIDRLLDKIKEGSDFVNGVRSWKGEPVLNKWQSRLFNWVTQKAAGCRINDLNSPVKAFRREVFQNIPLYGDFYRFFPILAERRGFRVSEVPIQRKEERKRSTVYGLPSYIQRLLDILNLIFITRFTEKPLRFFGGFGVFSFLIGVVINALLVFQRFVLGEGMADRPMLLLGMLFMVIGIQLISIGLIGEMVIFARTREFSSYEIEEMV